MRPCRGPGWNDFVQCNGSQRSNSIRVKR
jgi:hypothetical protein